MAKMDGMDTLLAMGLLGSILDPDAISKARAARPPFDFKEGEKKPLDNDELIAKGATSAKKIYDSYVEVGFNEVQAFELLKLVLTNKNR